MNELQGNARVTCGKDTEGDLRGREGDELQTLQERENEIQKIKGYQYPLCFSSRDQIIVTFLSLI